MLTLDAHNSVRIKCKMMTDSYLTKAISIVVAPTFCPLHQRMCLHAGTRCTAMPTTATTKPTGINIRNILFIVFNQNTAKKKVKNCMPQDLIKFQQTEVKSQTQLNDVRIIYLFFGMRLLHTFNICIAEFFFVCAVQCVRFTTHPSASYHHYSHHTNMNKYTQ